MFRIAVQASNENGLHKPAQTTPRDKIGERIGRQPHSELLAVTRALAVFLGFA